MESNIATPGQLGSMTPGEAPADACVSSPPYEGSLEGKSDSLHHKNAPDSKMRKSIRAGRTCQDFHYNGTEGNVGNTSGDTFWQAARQIVEQTALCLKDGACSAWIVKRYVKAGKVVPFPDQWASLLEQCGFRVVCRARAWLVQETREPGLFEAEVVTRTERKSFFRRLHEKKSPGTRIDWEDVIFAVKVGAGGGGDCAVSSPPYAEGLGHGGSPTRGAARGDDTNLDAMQKGYGDTAGNLGAMRPGEAP